MEAFTTTETFRSAFDTQAASGNKFLVIMTGAIDEATNESWCSDCVEAKPQIDRIIAAATAGSRKVLKGIVSREEWSGNAAHPFRQPPFGAQGVPTMVLYEGTNALYKVDDLEAFADSDQMDMFLDEL